MQQLLYVLPALMCPLGMGAMMWFMMKGKSQPSDPVAPAGTEQAELARLRAEVDQLRAAHRPGAPTPDDVPVSLGKTSGAVR